MRTCILDTWCIRICTLNAVHTLNTVQKQYFVLVLNVYTFWRTSCTFTSDVVLGLGHWSLVVLKDKILVLVPVLGLESWVLGLGFDGLVVGQPRTKHKDNVTANCSKCKRCEWHFKINVINLVPGIHDDDWLRSEWDNLFASGIASYNVWAAPCVKTLRGSHKACVYDIQIYLHESATRRGCKPIHADHQSTNIIYKIATHKEPRLPNTPQHTAISLWSI